MWIESTYSESRWDAQVLRREVARARRYLPIITGHLLTAIVCEPARESLSRPQVHDITEHLSMYHLQCGVGTHSLLLNALAEDMVGWLKDIVDLDERYILQHVPCD